MDEKNKIERKYAHLKHRDRTTNPDHVVASEVDRGRPPLPGAAQYAQGRLARGRKS